MAFWSDPSSLLPKQSHRWVAFFGNTEDPNSLPQYFFKSIEKPSYEIGSVQAKYLYSHTFNFPKRVTWKPIKVEFYDVLISSGQEIIPIIKGINPYGSPIKEYHRKSTQMFFYSLLSKAGYFSPHETLNKEMLTFKNYTFKQNLSLAMFGTETTDLKNSYGPYEWYVTLQEIDENGEKLESWQLYNPFITNVNFNKLDYSSDNILTITADIAYDWAELDSRIYKSPEQIELDKLREQLRSEPIKSRGAFMADLGMDMESRQGTQTGKEDNINIPLRSETSQGVNNKQTDYTAGLPLDLSQPVTDGKSVVPRTTEVTYGNTDYYFAAGSNQLAITKK